MQENTDPKDQSTEQVSKILATETTDSEMMNHSPVDDEDDEDDHDENTANSDDEMNLDDFSGLTKEELAKHAEDYIHYPDVRKANLIFQKMRNYLDEILRKDRELQLINWVKEGNEARDFKASADEAKNNFYQAFQKFQDRRQMEREKAKVEKEKNLTAKQEILDKIKTLVDAEENEGSLEQLRNLQREWKQIRQVPREHMTDLWESYRFYLDKFYDNLSINNELKELDRQKNLETKIDLCLKVDELRGENNIKKALIMLNKFHDEYKNTGPVPIEATEEIWKRFKAASDLVLAEKKDVLTDLKEERNQNLKAKVILCEKVEQIAEIPYLKLSEWNSKTDEVKQLFEDWRTVGPAPKANNDSIWKRFRDAMDAFYANKSEFFKGLNELRKDNLAVKEELCIKAEALQASHDWQSTTKEMIALQKEWKESGPVPDKSSDAIWKRFRTACDTFFNAKNEAFKGQKDEENENYNNKLSLLKEVEAITALENGDEAIAKLKDIHQQWVAIGHVPFKKKDHIFKDYQVATDAIYSKFKKNRADMMEGRMKDHYETLANVPNGDKRLKDEERKISGKIKFLTEELKTIENNMAFFSNSKGAEKMLKPFQEKIDNTQGLIEKLKAEIKMIRIQLKSNAS